MPTWWKLYPGHSGTRCREVSGPPWRVRRQCRAHLGIRPWLQHQHCPGQSQAVHVSKSLRVCNSHVHAQYRYVFPHVHNRNNTISKPKHMMWEHPGHGTGNMMGEFAFCVREGTGHSLWKGKNNNNNKTCSLSRTKSIPAQLTEGKRHKKITRMGGLSVFCKALSYVLAHVIATRL